MSTLGIKGPYLIFKLILRERKRKGGRAGGREKHRFAVAHI